jgi:hypothetical protein
VGQPPVIDIEVRLDSFTQYPTLQYQDITAGYNFAITAAADFTANPTYHVITQVHNTDPEDGKPTQFDWDFNNPNGLTWQFYYENVTEVTSESLALANYSGSLANDFVQQESLVVQNAALTRVYEQDVDYSVDWETGDVTVVAGGSISGTVTVKTRYFHYAYASDLADVSGVNQWTALGGQQTGATIDLLDLTAKTNINTVRFKVKE